MTRMHIAVEFTFNADDDEFKKALPLMLGATGITWVSQDAESDYVYKAFEGEGEEKLLVGTVRARPIDRWFKTDGQKLQDVSNAIQKVASERRWQLHSNHMPDQITALVDHAEREGNNAVREMKSLLENLISHLRGMEIVVDMVGNASTHTEKNARLRGLGEVIQTAIRRATEFSYDFSWKHWGNYNDLFKSDFPMRDVMRKLNEKDAEIKRLKALAGEAAPEPEKPQSDDDYSF